MNGIATAFTATVVRAAECLVSHKTGARYLKLRAIVDEHRGHDRHFVDVLLFDDGATNELAATLTKGVELYIEGRLRLERWTNRAGEPGAGLSVIARRLEPLGRFGRSKPSLVASDRRHTAEMTALRARLEALQPGRSSDDDAPSDAIDDEPIPF